MSAGKVGLFGPGGSGKTLTAFLIAIGVSKELHGGAGITFVDPEGVAEFVRPVCEAEGVPLTVVSSHTFLDMRDALPAAEQAGSCAFVVDHYDGIFRELTEAQKIALNLQGRRLPYQHREELVRIWDAWVRSFRASPLACIFSGRLAWEWGDDEDEAGEAVKVKLGTKMRGESDAGYEPNLLIELEAIQDKAARDRSTRSKQGSIRHHAYVLKDRRMVLNGRRFDWKDLNAYKAGDYQRVWKNLGPHFTAGQPGILRGESAPRSSVNLFAAPTSESRFADATRRRTIAIEEIQGALNTLWPGRTDTEKRLRSIVTEALFRTRSWTAIGGLAPEVLESAWRKIQSFEEAASQIDTSNEAQVIDLVTSCIELERAAVEAMVT